MIDLLGQPHGWIRRRVERIEFVDDQTARRAVSVDFKLPPWYAASADVREVGTWLVPLAMLVKRPLVNFDLRDEQGGSLSLVDSGEYGLVAAAALVVRAGATLARYGHQDHEGEIARDLEHVATCKVGEAESAVDRALDPSRPGGSSRRMLAQDPQLCKLMRDLAQNFLVLTPIARPDDVRVIKFSYQEPIEYRRKASLLDALGWRDASFRWSASGASMARSYHCEVCAPEDLQIRYAKLVAVGSTTEQVVDHHGATERVHLYLNEVRQDANAIVRAELHTNARGLLSSSAALGIATSLLLTGGVIFRGAVSDPNDASATLLVAIPALLAAYLAKPGEHRLVTRLLSGVRLLVVGIGTLAFLAAVTLAVRIDPDTEMLAVWIPLAALSWLATLGLIASAALPRPRHHLSSGT